MRKLLSALVLSIFFTTAFSSHAAPVEVAAVPYAGASKKFAIMVNDPGLFKAAVHTSKQLDVGNKKYNFEIVIVGKLAKDIVDDENLKDDINQSLQSGVKISVCNNALEIFKADKSKLDKRIAIVPNGWIYMFELKDQGYNTLSTSK